MEKRLLSLLAFSATLLGTQGSPAIQSAESEYEYVIVGSGAGGGTLAARLALNGKKTLLIEAGDDQGSNTNMTVPVYHPYSTEDEKMRWDFWVNHYTDEEEAKKDSKIAWTTPSGAIHVGKSPPAGSKLKGVLYPRSATLGGCTAHNAMAAVYPHESDWSHIANITGDKSWDPKLMRKLWQRLERNEYATAGTAGHGFSGSLATSKPPVTLAAQDLRLMQFAISAASAISKTVLEIGKHIERATLGDLNSADADRDKTEGVWLLPLTVSHNNEKKVGMRAGSRDIVLDVLNAQNADGTKKYPLTLAMDTLATQVVFDEAKKLKAVGIEVMKGKSLYRADPRANLTGPMPPITTYRASKEVVLSGGAYNSPQLLKLSGIGPKAELAGLKIPLRLDLPGVGTNLQDHFEIGHTARSKSNFTIAAKCTFGKGTDPCLADWQGGQGVYGNSNGFIFGVVKRSSVASQDIVYGADPDLIIFGGLAEFRGYYPGYANDVYDHNVWTWVVLKAHSGQRAGTVKLVTSDPRDTPRIDANYFDSKDGAGQRDLTAMAEGIDLARKITFNVTDLGKSLDWQESHPGKDKIFPSKGLEDHIRAEAWSHHASCTNPIGAANDPMAVLDSNFRVRGVEGLRVVDASAFPRVPGYFIAIPTYMLGEKAADAILQGS